MSFKITWTKEAVLSYSEIINFTIEVNESNTYAQKIIKEIQIALKRLSTYPFTGTKVVENQKIRKSLVLSRYYIFYQIDKTKKIIKVLRIWDNRQNPTKLKSTISQK